MRAVLVGSDSWLSYCALQSLGRHCVAVVTESFAQSPIRTTTKDSLADRALRQDCAVYEGLIGPGFQTLVQRHRPDCIVVACYRHKLDMGCIRTLPLGAINLHPSLLPAYRGPAPLFWQLKHAALRFGISLHRLSEKIDAGPIISQMAFETTVDDSYSMIIDNLEQRSKAILDDFIANTDKRIGAQRVQNETKASYQSWPTPEDFTIASNLDVGLAYRFIEGCRHWQSPYTLQSRGTTVQFSDAYGYVRASAPPPGALSVALRNGHLLIR